MDAVKKYNPDLAIINLSTLGREAIRQFADVVSKNSSMPFIFLTTLPESRHKKITLDGRCIFSSIPFSDEELMTTVNSLLQKVENRWGYFSSDEGNFLKS